MPTSAGERLGSIVPVPDTPAVFLLFPASSVTIYALSLHDALPILKVTLIVQFPPAATLDPQLLVCPKSPGLAPVKAMPVMLNAVLVGLESVIGRAHV